MMQIETILKESRRLRNDRKFDQAYHHLKSSLCDHPEFQFLIWQHSPIFWSDISAGICTLTRRKSEDTLFLREIWGQNDFGYVFNRNSAPLPEDDATLQKILDAEMTSLMEESRALHWIIRDKNQRPWGLLSLCDVSFTHKRAEVLLGIMPEAPPGLVAAAMFMLYEFFFKFMQFNKLCAMIFKENTRSFKATLHLGFNMEGELKQHSLDPRTGKYVDVIQLGILAESAFQANNQRLKRRLLGPQKSA